MNKTVAKLLISFLVVGCAWAVGDDSSFLPQQHAGGAKMHSASTPPALRTTPAGVDAVAKEASDEYDMKNKARRVLDHVMYKLSTTPTSTFLITAVMVGLAAFASKYVMCASDAVAFWWLVMCLPTVQDCPQNASGTGVKCGFTKRFTAIPTILMTASLFLVFLGRNNRELFEFVSSFLPALLGLLGVTGLPPWMGPALTFVFWFSYFLLGFGVVALVRFDPTYAVGCAALLETIVVVDYLFVRKMNGRKEFSIMDHIEMLIVPALTAISVLLGRSWD